MASRKRKIKNVGELCLAGAAIALVVEVDGDRLGVVCVEITTLFLSESVASDDWYALAYGQQYRLRNGHLRKPARR